MPLGALIALTLAGIAVVVGRHRHRRAAFAGALVLALASAAVGSGAEGILLIGAMYLVGLRARASVAWSALGAALVCAAAAALAAETSGTGKGLPVAKIVERDHTKLKFTRAIEPGFRWARILDGIEGALEIDFSEAGDLSPTVIAAASVAIHGLPPDVQPIRVIASPIGLATEIDDRCEVVSVSCAGRCPQCAKPSIAILAYDEIRQRLMTGSSTLRASAYDFRS